MTTVSRTAPYPWPCHEGLDPRRTALVVAGAQLAWASRSLHVDAVTSAIEALARQLTALGGQVVVIAHHALGGKGGLGPRPALPPSPGTPDAELLALAGLAHIVVHATGISGFHGSHLDGELRARGVDLLVMTGFGYEATVECTLRAANDRGYECLTLSDAVAPFDEATGACALSSITMSGGIFGAIGTSGDLSAALSDLDRDGRSALAGRPQPTAAPPTEPHPREHQP